MGPTASHLSVIGFGATSRIDVAFWRRCATCAHTEVMDVKRALCRLVGHQWHHHRAPGQVVKSTCRRCGLIEFGHKDGPDWRAQHIPPGGSPGGPG
jgi:hypothetical protein